MYIMLVCVLVMITCAILFKLYQVYTCGVCTSKVDMTGKVVIVTGSDRGIGYATAHDLAARGARVILACVDRHVAETAEQRIRRRTNNDNVVFKHLDLASLQSIRNFADDILSTETRLDVLINNAGVVYLNQKRTKDGLIAEVQINYLGPFLLTNLLIPILKRSAPSRIVNVASLMHWCGSTDLTQLDKEIWSDVQVYSNTKLWLIMFTKELSRSLSGSGVVANCLHPGSVRSHIYNNANFFLRVASFLYNNIFFKTARQGAQTSIHLAVSEECGRVSGCYFSDCRPLFCSPKCDDRVKAKQLWELSARAVKLDCTE